MAYVVPLAHRCQQRVPGEYRYTCGGFRGRSVAVTVRSGQMYTRLAVTVPSGQVYTRLVMAFVSAPHVGAQAQPVPTSLVSVGALPLTLAPVYYPTQENLSWNPLSHSVATTISFLSWCYTVFTMVQRKQCLVLQCVYVSRLPGAAVAATPNSRNIWPRRRARLPRDDRERPAERSPSRRCSCALQTPMQLLYGLLVFRFTCDTCPRPPAPCKTKSLQIGLHFYTLNLERSVRLILDGLGYTETAATRRMYPWRASALSKRAAEDVR